MCVSKKTPKPEFLWSFLFLKDKNPKTRSLGLCILEESPTGQLRTTGTGSQFIWPTTRGAAATHTCLDPPGPLHQLSVLISQLLCALLLKKKKQKQMFYFVLGCN